MQIKSRVSDTGGQSARPQMAVQQHSLWFGPPLQSFNMKTLEDTSSVNAFVSRTADLTTMYQSWTLLTTYLINCFTSKEIQYIKLQDVHRVPLTL